MYGKCLNEEEDKTITLVDRVRKAWYNQGIKLEEEGGEVEEVQAADAPYDQQMDNFQSQGR